MSHQTRVRFAPSPTGLLHIGGLRTALFNYLHAKSNAGVFVLRVEDTDNDRLVVNSESYINKVLHWCGLHPDESPTKPGAFSPYKQSERLKHYQKYAQQLIDNGKAYRAFDDQTTLSNEREKAKAKGDFFSYNHTNRLRLNNELSRQFDAQKSQKNPLPHVIRLKITPNEKITVVDKLRGFISIDTNQLDDKILIKSDGMPTYHFANVVDDHLMRITAVIRGEEWLPSLPLHKLLYDYFNWSCPDFYHLPLILNPNGKGKLSKRQLEQSAIPLFPVDTVEEVANFKTEGFLPEALLNYLALLGWTSNNGKEIFSLQELIEAFPKGQLQKAGANFDYNKAKWVNHQHIQKLTAEKILALNPDFVKKLNLIFDKDKQIKIVDALKHRLYTFRDLFKEAAFFLNLPQYDDRITKKLVQAGAANLLTDFAVFYKFSGDIWQEVCRKFLANRPYSTKQLMQAIRFSLVGQLSGPDIGIIVAIIGKSVTLNRLARASNYLTSKEQPS